MATEKKFTTAEVAEREGVSVKRIQALVRQKRITGVKTHGNAFAFASDYTILPPPIRNRKRRNQET